MSRIGSIGTLGSQQLRVLNRLQQLGQAISENTLRISTLKKLNSAKDNPSGLIQASLLEQELASAEKASQGITRANAMLKTADSAAATIVSQLQKARALVLEAAGGTLSSSGIAANQIEVDTILRGIDATAKTEFSGKQLLTGASGFRVTGFDNTQIVDIDVLDKQTAIDTTVALTINSQATKATNSYTGGTLTANATLIITGPDGASTISLNNGDTKQNVADTINAATYATGITATVNGANVDFATVDFGTAATITIAVTQGTFALSSSGTTKGTDAQATINGQSVTGDGSVFNFNSSSLSLRVKVDPTANGTLTSFVVAGEGLNFVIGSAPSDTARIGLPNLTTSSLGGVTGKLSSIMSGGANTLTGGKTAEALKIIDDAIGDATRSQAIVGGFQKYTLDTAKNVLTSTIKNVSSALSAIQDTDLSIESALLANNKLMQQAALQALSVVNLQNQSVLSVLSAAAARF